MALGAGIAAGIAAPPAEQCCNPQPNCCTSHNSPQTRDVERGETDVQLGPLLQDLSHSDLLMLLFITGKRNATETQ